MEKEFDWDLKKRSCNLNKHYIDFIDAIKIFDDPFRIEKETSRNSELRFITIGEVNDVVLLVAYAIRKNKYRIISARRASKNERKAYEENSKER